MPRSAAAGTRIDWPLLCQYGKESAALYRAYLSVCSVLDNSARHGQPLTRQIAAPVIGHDGKRKRRKGGVIVRDPGTLIDNPAAQFVKRLTDADAARFVGFDPASKQRRHDARRALERLADDGVIEIEHTGGGRFRIFAPNPRKAVICEGACHARTVGVSCADRFRRKPIIHRGLNFHPELP